MKVKTLVQVIHNYPEGDPRIWYVIPPGTEVDFPEGAEWIADGLAVPVAEIQKEKAVLPEPEKRTLKAQTSKPSKRSKKSG